MAQAGGAQAFAREQVVGDDAAGNGVLVLEQQAACSNARFLLVASTFTRRFMGSASGYEAGARF
jgi:hypothetical protein